MSTPAHRFVPPDVRVEINERELPPEAVGVIVGVEITQKLNRANDFRFTVRDVPTEGRYRWIDSDLFGLGNDVRISLGYAGELQEVVRGRMQGLSPEYTVDGLVFAVEGSDEAYELLMVESEAKVFRRKTDSDIVREVARAAGLRARVDPTEPIFAARTKPAGASDFRFIESLASDNGYELRLAGRELVFGRPTREAHADVTLEWEREILEFHASVNTRRTVTDVVVRGWDRTAKREIVGRAGAGDEWVQEQGRRPASVITRELYGDVVKVMSRRPVASAEEASSVARAELSLASDTFIRGEVRTVGNPWIRCGSCLELLGLGERFSGKYYVEAVTHRTGPAEYTTLVDVRRNSL